jgi:pyruvate,water dikinase
MIGFRGASATTTRVIRPVSHSNARPCAGARGHGPHELEGDDPVLPHRRGRPRVQAEMEKHGLKRGVNGLEIYVMCEIPSNVILAAEFAEIFDGFSIGSNDLTQLILGVDRDSEIVAPIFNERNAAVKTMIAQVIQVCRRSTARSASAARRRATTRSSPSSSSSKASTASRSIPTP